MIENICHFIPYHKDYHSIHTINFVLETKRQEISSLKSESIYKMHYVCSGNGFIHFEDKVQALTEGDVFITYPAHPFCIESKENFSYMYISFLGSRANMIMEKLKINKNNYHFTDCQKISDFWKSGFNFNSELTDLISESILLYTFSYIGNRITSFYDKNKINSNTAMYIKKYIDDNFLNPDISLASISKEISYNKKYISSVFKKTIGIGIIEYLNTIRVQYACTLIQHGLTCVNDIAVCCGYSDPLYFSKVFKEKMGISPRDYMKSK